MDENLNQMFLGLIAYIGGASTEVQVDVVGIFLLSWRQGKV